MIEARIADGAYVTAPSTIESTIEDREPVDQIQTESETDPEEPIEDDEAILGQYQDPDPKQGQDQVQDTGKCHGRCDEKAKLDVIVSIEELSASGSQVLEPQGEESTKLAETYVTQGEGELREGHGVSNVGDTTLASPGHGSTTEGEKHRRSKRAVKAATVFSPTAWDEERAELLNIQRRRKQKQGSTTEGRVMSKRYEK